MQRLRAWRPSSVSPTIVLSVLAIVLAMSGWTFAAIKGSGGGGTIYGCVVKKGDGKGLMRFAAHPKCPKGTRLISFNRRGPTGPAGEPGPAGAPAPLAGLEAVHLVGESGQPEFEDGASNSLPASTSRAGFYKDQLGIVHLQGTVDAGEGLDVFRLPPDFRPPKQVCFSVPGFDSGVNFVTNRLCVLAETGEVRNSDGEAVSYINLDGIEFRTTE